MIFPKIEPVAVSECMRVIRLPEVGAVLILNQPDIVNEPPATIASAIERDLFEFASPKSAPEPILFVDEPTVLLFVRVFALDVLSATKVSRW